MNWLDLLFPQRCPFCSDRRPLGQRGICEACKKTLPYMEPDRILRSVDGYTCAVTFHYERMVRDAIHALKFKRQSARARALAPYLVQTVSEELGGEFDVVTYVPISSVRRFRRGFDQTQLLAKHCCRIWDVELVKMLRKVRNNPPQSTVKTAKARKKNVENVFRVLPDAGIAGRRILLIDDLTTSGSTLSVCAKLLTEAGAASVVCAALAGSRTDDIGILSKRNSDVLRKKAEKSSQNNLQSEKNRDIITI